jgi:hypothetical protein
MTSVNDTIRVVIPLTIRKRNGRPKILPPDSIKTIAPRSQDPHILKALGRAWAWRRKLESGEFATVGDIAKAESVTDRFISRTMRLSYLSPEVLERLVVGKEPPATTWNDLVKAASMPWNQQQGSIFGN